MCVIDDRSELPHNLFLECSEMYSFFATVLNHMGRMACLSKYRKAQIRPVHCKWALHEPTTASAVVETRAS